MIFETIDDGNGGRRIWKKKFALAVLSLFAGYGFLGYIVSQVGSWNAGDIGSFLGALSTYTLAVLGPVYAADVIDKKLNGKAYHAVAEDGTG
jgi:hypothetical protein